MEFEINDETFRDRERLEEISIAYHHCSSLLLTILKSVILLHSFDWLTKLLLFLSACLTNQ